MSDIQGLVFALGELMSSEETRRRMGQYAEQLSHRFDLSEIVKQWRELLSKEYTVVITDIFASFVYADSMRKSGSK